MLKFNRSKKRLVIPVGINPNYGIDIADLYNTNDADVVANDVLEGKIAYGKDGKIVGTLDVQSEKEESYQEGYEFGYDEGNNAGYQLGYNEGNEAGYQLGYDKGNEIGIEEQKSKLESITITENGSYNREDGWNSVVVDVPDLNGDYNEGVEAGIEIGRAEVIEGMNDATITAGTVFKGEVGYGKDGERIVGDFEYVEGFDFGKIGYNTEESNEVNISISDDIAYSKALYDRWNTESSLFVTTFFRNNKKLKYVPNINLDKHTANTSMESTFSGCENIIYVPLLNTSKFTNMKYMFQNCSKLISVPLFNTSNVRNMYYMFNGCSKLTSIPLFDTSNVTDMGYMFNNCSKLTSVHLFNTSNVTNMGYMFYNCSSLTSIPEFNTSNVTSLRNAFGSCNLTEFPSLNTENVKDIDGFIKNNSNLITIQSLNLQSINVTGGLGTWNGFDGLISLENVVALNNFGQGFSGTTNNGITLTHSSKLTRQSCLNIFNTIYDMNLNTSYTGTPTIQLSSTTKTLLSSDDIAIATSKGWTVS